MDAVREQLNRPLVAGIVGLIIGLIIGWFVIGWGLWPVQWVNASPADLRSEWQVEYLRMAIDSYVLHQNPVVAQQRYNDLGDNAPDVLAKIEENPSPQSPEAIQAFANAVQAAPPAPGTTPQATQTAEAAAPAAGTSAIRTLLPIMCGLTVLLLLAFAVLFFLRGRSQAPRAKNPVMEAQEAARQAQWTDYSEVGEEPPMAQFMASYKIGDDLFDDSFSVDSPSGEFLGECGVGISETIGVGDPKKVTAFEVWLFDKNDIQTVTKVLMSKHAFEDETIRQRLAAKGEPVMANPGNQVVLETATLQLVARVVDMNYGEGALPEDSFFDSLILELAVWQK